MNQVWIVQALERHDIETTTRNVCAYADRECADQHAEMAGERLSAYKRLRKGCAALLKSLRELDARACNETKGYGVESAPFKLHVDQFMGLQ